jgi:hypothetical protein
LNLGQITSWNNGWWLVVDTDLETSWAPVNELNGTLGLDGGDGRVDILEYKDIDETIEITFGTTSPRYNKQQAMYFP